MIGAGSVPLTVLDAARVLPEQPDNVRMVQEGMDAEIGEWFQELVRRNNAWKEAKEQNLPAPSFEKRILLVHGLPALREALSDDGLDKLKVFLEKCQPEYGVTFIFTAQPEQISTFSFEPWFRDLGPLNRGIWVGGGIADQYQLKITKITNQLYEELDMNFGYLVMNGKPRLVKLLSQAKGDEWMDKILVEVFVPAEGVTYDVLLPRELKIREVIFLLSKAFSDLSNGCYEEGHDTLLCDHKTGKILDMEHSVYELALHNGSSLMLI